MKKKKNFKKKILGITLSALLVSLPFITNKTESVKAANNCVNYINDYVFLETDGYANLADGAYSRTTGSVFPADMPSGFDASTANMSGEWILQDGSINDSTGYWTKNKIASDVIKNWTTNVTKTKPDVVGDIDGKKHWIYYHNQEWTDNKTGSVSSSAYDASSFDVSELAQNIYIAHNASHGPDIKSLISSGSDLLAYITRTMTASEISALKSEMAARHDSSQTHHWFMPAIYRLTYQVCEGGGDEPVPSGEEWSYTIEFRDQDTGEKLPDDVLSTYQSRSKDWGDSVTDDCGKEVYEASGYTSVGGVITMTKSNNVGVCYYKKNNSNPDSGKWNYIVTHKIEGTDETVPGSKDVRGLTTRSSYNHLCYSSINGYTRVTDSLTLTESSNEGVCYYKKDDVPTDKTCNVTFHDRINNVNIPSPVTFNGETQTNPMPKNDACSSYVIDDLCPVELTSDGKLYTRYQKPTIDDDTTNVICEYTPPEKGNPQTGDSLIFVVWAVGLGAIAYSVYFFRNYYKKQNEV